MPGGWKCSFPAERSLSAASGLRQKTSVPPECGFKRSGPGNPTVACAFNLHSGWRRRELFTVSFLRPTYSPWDWSFLIMHDVECHFAGACNVTDTRHAALWKYHPKGDGDVRTCKAEEKERKLLQSCSCCRVSPSPERQQLVAIAFCPSTGFQELYWQTTGS